MTPTDVVPQTHWLYRYFDASGQLLYIGCTSNPSTRDAQHRTYSPWAGRIARREIVEHADCAEALAAERAAIASEHPEHNTRHVVQPGRLTWLAETLLTHGVSVKALAVGTGIPTTTLQRRVNRPGSLTVPELAAIARHLHLRVSDLLPDEPVA